MRESFVSKEQRESSSAKQVEDWDAAKGLGRKNVRLDFPINKYLVIILVPECISF